MKSNQTKTMAATFRLTAVRFALVGIAALCIAGCGKDEPPAEVNRRPSGDVMTEQKSEKTKAEAEAQRREQALPSPEERIPLAKTRATCFRRLRSR